MSDSANQASADSLIDSLRGDVRLAVQNRLSNPFLASYLIALVTINYRFFVVLLSQESYQKSFRYIEATLYPTFGEFLIKVFLLPLAAAMFFTFVWPALEPVLVGIKELAQERGSRWLIKVRQQRTVPLEEQARFFEQWNAENEQLKAQLSDLDGFHRDRYQRLSKKHDSINELLKASVLELVCQRTGAPAAWISSLGRGTPLTSDLTTEQRETLQRSSFGKVVKTTLTRYYGGNYSLKQAPVTYSLAKDLASGSVDIDPSQLLVDLWAAGILVDFDAAEQVGRLAPANAPAVVAWRNALGIYS